MVELNIHDAEFRYTALRLLMERWRASFHYDKCAGYEESFVSLQFDDETRGQKGTAKSALRLNIRHRNVASFRNLANLVFQVV